MNSLPYVQESPTKPELLSQVKDIQTQLVNFYTSIPDTLFLSNPVPDGWTIKGNIKHISYSIRFFSLWVGSPSGLLKLFGNVKKTQPKAESLISTNRPSVNNYGKYTHGKPISQKDKESSIQILFKSFEKLYTSIDKRTDEELDQLKFLMPKYSLRTGCYLILKHSIHHTNVVRQRLSES